MTPPKAIFHPLYGTEGESSASPPTPPDHLTI
jgi:hypothetical protein